MHIDLTRLNYTFTTPPLLIGGKAMEYYDLRPAGADIDFVVTEADYLGLRAQYPDCLKNLWGDLGVCPLDFEIWRSICLFTYADLEPGAVAVDGYRVISIEKLLFLKAMAYKVEKCRRDLELIVDRIGYDRFTRDYEPVIQWEASLPKPPQQG